MLAQHRAATRASGVAVITDSGADLPQSLCEDLDLHVVPVRVNFGDEDFLDKVSLTTAEFYARLRTCSELPKTSQPPPGDFRRQFEFLLSHHPHLVYVGVSRGLSGTLQSAEAAAARVDVERAVVLDSGHASCGQGLVALGAARAAREGANPERMRALVESLKARTHTFAAARDISFAVRGGRVPAWSRPLAELLGVTPIARMRDSGRLAIAGALWGRRDVPRRFAEYLVKRLPRGQRWRIIIGHGDCADDGQKLMEALQQRLECVEAWLIETGPAIGAHAGPRALVAGLQQVDSADAAA
jgi:DegV family protein with EDD domain